MSAQAEPGDDDRRETYPRYLDGHPTQTIERTAPVDHNYTGTFVLDDADTAPPADAPEHSNVPDGSLYQRCRVAFINADDDQKEEIDGKERVVLTRDYNPNWLPGEHRFAVTLTSSNWQAGTGKGDDYTPYYKYDLKIWNVDYNGEITTDDLLHSLTAKVQPQYEHLVSPDGTDYNIPFGEGSHVRVSTTWAENAESAFTRAHDMLRDALGHSIDYSDIYPDCKTSTRQEAHVRFHKKKAQDLKHALQQSADLIPHKNGDVNNLDGNARKGNWELFRFQSSDWSLIGGRDTDTVEIGIKIYFTSDPENAQGEFQHPKCEAWLADTKNGRVSWDDYDAMQRVLQELVISHLEHAGVREEHLIADDKFKPAERPSVEMKYCNARREWLRDHYQSLEPAVYHESMRDQTALPYDILNYLVHHGTADYEELASATGAARRTIREHVRRLEQDVGGASPGIVQRIRTSKTVVTFAEEMWRVAKEAVEKVRPDDTPEQLEERKEERERERDEREQRDRDTDDSTDDRAGDLEQPDWRLLSDLSAGFDAAKRLPQSALKVNIRHPNWRTDPAAGTAAGD